ncbi:hypothetical protein B0H16DRAFT_1815091 [Mycena metata]|uniref:Uncharacterized protein n=1 Tax=Mycena metata TaxID=1033252 RepID=A0AAD7J9P9_9AGAR|nr:hypothetical protein B0H16DRAFT_1815091 [Mycena metata]
MLILPEKVIKDEFSADNLPPWYCEKTVFSFVGWHLGGGKVTIVGAAERRQGAAQGVAGASVGRQQGRQGASFRVLGQQMFGGAAMFLRDRGGTLYINLILCLLASNLNRILWIGQRFLAYFSRPRELRTIPYLDEHEGNLLAWCLELWKDIPDFGSHDLEPSRKRKKKSAALGGILAGDSEDKKPRRRKTTKYMSNATPREFAEAQGLNMNPPIAEYNREDLELWFKIGRQDIHEGRQHIRDVTLLLPHGGSSRWRGAAKLVPPPHQGAARARQGRHFHRARNEAARSAALCEKKQTQPPSVISGKLMFVFNSQ